MSQTHIVKTRTKETWRKNYVTIEATENGTYYSVHFKLEGLKSGWTEQIRKDKFQILMFLDNWRQVK